MIQDEGEECNNLFLYCFLTSAELLGSPLHRENWMHFISAKPILQNCWWRDCTHNMNNHSTLLIYMCVVVLLENSDMSLPANVLLLSAEE